jgi:hypothetical protein
VFRRGWVVLLLLGLAACGGDEDGGFTGVTATASPTAPPALADTYALLSPLSGVVAAAPERRAFDAATAGLTGPHFSFAVPAVAAVTGTLPEPVATGLRLRPGTAVPEGRQLLLVEIARPAAAPAPSPGSGTEVTVAVADGARSYAVRGGATGLTAGTLAIVLPARAAPVLRVTDAGRTQSLDLTTGRRGKDAVAGYYPVRRGEWETDSSATVGLRLYGAPVAALGPDDRLAALGLEDTPASLLPYVEGRGWAKPGRAWLVVEAEVAYGRRSSSPTDPDVVVVPASSFAATTDRGGRIPLSGDPIRIGEGGTPTTPAPAFAGTRLTADVPASVRRVTVTFTFRGTITTPNGPVTWTALADAGRTITIPLT